MPDSAPPDPGHRPAVPPVPTGPMGPEAGQTHVAAGRSCTDRPVRGAAGGTRRLGTPDGLPPTAALAATLPLLGVTVLAVEDSRFASDALRLMCQRSGARLRRAESLAVAHRHLGVYRPDVAIVDLGLPDGRGEGLIRQLATSALRPRLILGTSGDPAGRAAAMGAGADAFLEKPLASLAEFWAALAPVARFAPSGGHDVRPAPDPLALIDDLEQAARLAGQGADAAGRRYLGGFVGGLARHSGDRDLADAAGATRATGGMDRLSRLLAARIGRDRAAFPPRIDGG